MSPYRSISPEVVAQLRLELEVAHARIAELEAAAAAPPQTPRAPSGPLSKAKKKLARRRAARAVRQRNRAARRAAQTDEPPPYRAPDGTMIPHAAEPRAELQALCTKHAKMLQDGTRLPALGPLLEQYSTILRDIERRSRG